MARLEKSARRGNPPGEHSFCQEIVVHESQELHLGIFRSDYMLHAPNGVNGDITLKQVEFNTISASFGTLSEQTAALHRLASCE